MQPGRYVDFLGECRTLAASSEPFEPRGRLTRAAGLVMEAVGLKLPVGAQVVVAQEPKTARPRLDRANHPWRRTEDRGRRLPVGDALLGRVLDPNGEPIDRRGPLTEPSGQALAYQPLSRRPINAMEREPIRSALDVGVRAINALLTVGRGQRIGLFAGSGVGKSVLMGMMARYTSADVTVVGLIGERGREVKEFIEDILGPQGLRRAIVVAAPADMPPLVRLQGAAYATAIAEHFRDRGQHVLLLLDSLTRYAMAAREIALAIGEPPATKGYPPSVFARLPQLVERAGNAAAGGGSITGFYTVLTEGDDPQDPVADAARAILDGHIVLSRRLAEAGHYPAIDVEASIARDSAAARLARLEQQTQLAREHLQTLQGYSNDYSARLQARAGDQLDPAAQSNQRAFLARLRVALQTQQREVGAREQASAQARGELAACRRELKSLGTLIGRRAQEEQQRAARREQRHTDEAAQRASMQFR